MNSRQLRTLPTKEANDMIEKGIDAFEELHNKRDGLPKGARDPERREALERAYVTMFMGQYLIIPEEVS